jgi:hypothetical protein
MGIGILSNKKTKLKYDNIYELILTKEMHKKNLVRHWVLVLSLMSILKTKDKIETQIGTRQNIEIGVKVG